MAELPKFSLFASESDFLSRDPVALELLAGFHDVQEVEADAMDCATQAKWHAARAAAFRERARLAVNESEVRK